MELITAIEILEYHQQWRQGKREDMIHEPKKLTQALDIVLNEAKKSLNQDFYCYDEVIQIAEKTGDEIIKCNKQCDKCKSL